MRNPSFIQSFFGSVVGALIVAVGLVFYLQTQHFGTGGGGGGGGQRDGNPVGFDLVGNAGGTAPLTSTSGCLSNNNCTWVQVFYLTNPPPDCPTVQPVKVTCSGSKRALPSCPTNAQCVPFNAPSATAVVETDDDTLHALLPPTAVQGLLVFSAQQPSAK